MNILTASYKVTEDDSGAFSAPSALNARRHERLNDAHFSFKCVNKITGPDIWDFDYKPSVLKVC